MRGRGPRGLVGLLALVLSAVLVAGGGLAGAAFTTHQSNEQTFTAKDVPVPVADLVGQSRTNDGGASNNQIMYGLALRNTGTQQIQLTSVKVRYWFTADGSPGTPTPICYYSTFPCTNIRQSVVKLPKSLDRADHTSDVAFTQGQINPGASIALDQLALGEPGGGTFTQGNDYSFLSNSSFTDNPRVTVYVGGELVWGTEPAVVPDVESLEVRYQNLNPDPLDNAVYPGLMVRNTGNVTIDLRRVTLRYWFTSEPPKPLQSFCDYAQVGCPNVTRGFGSVSPTRPGADTYLQVGFSGGTVVAGGSTGGVNIRVHGADYSMFDERDDYSWATNTSFATTMKVTAYLDGQLVWGTPP